MLYKISKMIVLLLFRLLFRMEVTGRNHVPKTGPVIICSNHISNLDPPMVGITSPRDIYFMAKEELFSKKWLGWLLSRLHAFPVKRGMRDRQALRMGLKVLEEQHTLGLFPEGTRSKTGKLGKGLAGAGFFALRSEAVIIPCAIIGSYKLFGKVKVIYGQPIDLDYMRKNRASAQEVTDLIMNEIQKLLNSNK
ncbi:MAG: 1-acyl-sn-glycerol-3-phosphate acyltransferase [Bacillaceae bacterium]|nr:1-acyl-sn-glycerol-3-phosphate acyltransferase [Bacillaceae bacterium]